MERSLLEYVITLSPIIIAHVAVPPMSYFRGERVTNVGLNGFLHFLYSLLPENCFHQELISSLIRDTNAGLDSTVISHLFVHGDYSHLFGNLMGVIQVGHPIYREFGTAGLYALFLSGGAIASLPTFLHEGQRNAMRKLVYKKLAIQQGSNLRGSRISGQYYECG